jgi:hypothetical protein
VIKVLDKAVTALEALAASPSPSGLALVDLARVTELPVSTLGRLLTSLEQHRLVERDPRTRRYGLRGGALGGPIGPRVDGGRAARRAGAGFRASDATDTGRPMPHDFSRSFLLFRSDRVNHTPRLQLDAVCTVTASGEAARQFVLTTACVGENMYVAEGLVQLPAYEFVMIAEHRTEYAIRKRGATTAEDVREARRFGEAMPTYSGHQTRVTELAVRLVPLEHATPLTTYDEIQAAMLAQQPITCRTSYTAAANGTRVVLEYPAKIVNVQHDRPNWQIDTGPILVPDFEATSTLFVGRLELAYILFNSWNRAEVLERRPTPVTSAGDRGPQTSHYSAVHSLAVRNELFAGR